MMPPITKKEMEMTTTVLSSIVPLATHDEKFRESLLKNRKLLSFYENAILETTGNTYDVVTKFEVGGEDFTLDLFTWDALRYLYLPSQMGITRGVVDAMIHDGVKGVYKGLPIGMGFPKGDRRVGEVLSLGKVRERENYRELSYINGRYEGDIRVYEVDIAKSPIIKRAIDPSLN